MAFVTSYRVSQNKTFPAHLFGTPDLSRKNLIYKWPKQKFLPQHQRQITNNARVRIGWKPRGFPFEKKKIFFGQYGQAQSYFFSPPAVSPSLRFASRRMAVMLRRRRRCRTAPPAISRAPEATSALPARSNAAREIGKWPAQESSWPRGQTAGSTPRLFCKHWSDQGIVAFGKKHILGDRPFKNFKNYSL